MKPSDLQAPLLPLQPAASNPRPAAPPSTRLLLIRHAEVEASYQGVFGGRIDMDLSPRGHDQAATLARYLHEKPLSAIYASPMKRVQQTLAPLLVASIMHRGSFDQVGPAYGVLAAWIQANALLRSPPFAVDRFGLYSTHQTGEGTRYVLERDYRL